MGLHLPVVPLVLGELTVLEHQVVGHHVELQLLVLGVHHQVLLLVGLGEGGARGVDESKHPGANLVDPVHQLHHLLGVAGHGGVDDHGLVGEALVAGGQKLRRVLHIHGQLGAAPHIHFHLHTGGIGAADADEVDAIEAIVPDLVQNLLNLGPQGQGAIDAVHGLLLIEVLQAGPLDFLPGSGLIFHMNHFS